jgi:hypothetical protein
MTLANGKTTQGRACEICGRVIAIGARGSLYAFNTHKSACEQKRGSPVALYPTNLGDRTRSPSATPSTMSLSPLMIPGTSLAPSLPASPLNSPIFSPIHSPFDTAFNSQDHGVYHIGQVAVRYHLRCNLPISSLPQIKSISSSTTSFQQNELGFCNEIPRSLVSFAVKSTFL